MGVFFCLSAIWRPFCIEKSRWEFEFCPLSGIKKRPLLGGCFSITTMLISIRNTELVRCREVVRFSEGPLSEARLYTYWSCSYIHASYDYAIIIDIDLQWEMLNGTQTDTHIMKAAINKPCLL